MKNVELCPVHLRSVHVLIAMLTHTTQEYTPPHHSIRFSGRVVQVALQTVHQGHWPLLSFPAMPLPGFDIRITEPWKPCLKQLAF